MQQQKLNPQDLFLVRTALERIGTTLAIDAGDLTEIIKATGVATTETTFDQDAEQQELEVSLHLIGICRCLSALTGADREVMRHWLRTSNRQFGDAPINVMKGTGGPRKVRLYLETMNTPSGQAPVLLAGVKP